MSPNKQKYIFEESEEFNEYLESIEISDPENIIYCATKMAEMNPDEPLAQLLLGEAYEMTGSFEDALRAYQAVSEVYEQHVLPELENNELSWDTVLQISSIEEMRTTIVADALFRIARIHFKEENIEKTLTSLKEVFKVRQENSNDWQLYSMSMMLSKKYSEGIKAARKSISINNKNANSWTALGLNLSFLAEQKQTDSQMELGIGREQLFLSAFDAFDNASELKPADPEVWSNLSHSYLKISRPEEALEAAKKALAIDPNFRSAKENHQEALEELSSYDDSNDDVEESPGSDDEDYYRDLGFPSAEEGQLWDLTR